MIVTDSNYTLISSDFVTLVVALAEIFDREILLSSIFGVSVIGINVFVNLIEYICQESIISESL
jgi:hypothetical protein